MDTSTDLIDPERPDLIPIVERAAGLVGRTVTARFHGSMDLHPVEAVAVGWDYESDGVVLVLDVDGEIDTAWAWDCEVSRA